MIDGMTLALFTAASLALLILPGPSVLYIVARSVDQGRAAGLVSTLGMTFGGLVHVAAAVLGISTILLSSATAFSVLRYAGAAYLIYLGIRTLLQRGRHTLSDGKTADSMKKVFWQAWLVQVLNPKTALFFLAFLPQFIDPGGMHPAVQSALLGLWFLVLAMITDATYAVLASKLKARWSGRWGSGGAVLQRYAAATTYFGLGLMTAFAGSRKGG